MVEYKDKAWIPDDSGTTMLTVQVLPLDFFFKKHERSRYLCCLKIVILDFLWFHPNLPLIQSFKTRLVLFNLYAEYIMTNAGLEEAQTGIKIVGEKYQ